MGSGGFWCELVARKSGRLRREGPTTSKLQEKFVRYEGQMQGIRSFYVPHWDRITKSGNRH
jgi:hypothetical protein